MSTTQFRKAPAALAILTSDPLSEAGAASLLQRCPQLTVLAGQDRAKADVIVLIADQVTDTVLAELHDVCAEQNRTEPPYCVVVTGVFDENCILSAVSCGVTVVLPKAKVDNTLLVTAVLNAVDGKAHLPPRLQRALLTQLIQMRRATLEPLGLTFCGLAAREQDVLRLVAEGFDTGEVAVKLAYSERTVKYVLHGVMTRYGLRNRSHAVAHAVRCGAI